MYARARLPAYEARTLEKLYLCMEYEEPELLMDEELRLKALKPITRMMDISRAAGLIG